MINPPTLAKKFEFQIWPGHGKMTEPLPSLKILNFRFGLDMEDDTHPTLTKVLSFRFGMMWKDD